ncbi:MAG: alpha/beta hydrolase [Pseudomonadota bacterium]
MRACVLALLLIVAGSATANDLATTTLIGGGGLEIVATANARTTGPSIVFVHGLLASTLNWERQFSSELADEFNLVAVDMRGHGASAKPTDRDNYLATTLWADDVKAAIDHSDSDKVVLVTWSYGSYFVMDYIRHYGTDRVAGIVLISTSAGFVPPVEREDTPQRRAQIARSNSANADTLLAWTNSYLDLVLAGAQVSEADRQRWLVSAMMVPHYVRALIREHRTNNEDLIPAIDVPVLFIEGADNRFSKLDEITSVIDRLVSASVEVLPDAGGLSFWSAASETNALIAKFVRQSQ